MAEKPAATFTAARRPFPFFGTHPSRGWLTLLPLTFAALAAAQETPPTAPPAAHPPVIDGKPVPPRPMPPPMRRQGMPPPGAPGPGPKPGGPGNGPGERGFPRSGASMSPLPTEGFERLPEEEKKRMRAAMEKAWSMPALQQAKERYIRANEEFRSAMRQALQEVDPEVVRILEKVKPQQQIEPRVMPKLPPPADDQFAKIAVERLGMEVLNFARPELRGRIRAAHAKVMQQPEVAEAVQRLLKAPAEQRVDELRKLRDIYRKAMGAELPNMGRPPQGQGPSASAAPSDLVPEPKANP